MRNVAKKGILTAVATGSVLASTAGYAYAGSEAQGGATGSPGVASGNSVQVPVEVPINACGNTADVVGLLNPAYGNDCANKSTGRHAGGGSSHTAGSAASGTAAGSPGVASGNSVQAPVHIPVNACGNSVDVVGVGNPAFGNSCGNTATPPPPPPPPPATGECSEECPENCPGGNPHNPPPPVTPKPTPTPTESTGTGGGRGGSPSQSPSTATPAAIPVAGPAASGPAQAPAPAAPVDGDSQLASTGAGGVELLGAAGLALLLGGGVLYRRARAGAR
ncbi:chaplin [Kitasatospora sp. NPDC054939]